VREDVLALYGFLTKVEQDLFERLIAISGVGPKLALAVLSGIEPPELIRAVRVQDVARLTAIPGVGKKTAERIGLELKDRLPAALQAAAGPAHASVSAADQLRDDLLSALVNLGYPRAAADKALEATLGNLPDPRFEDALKQALRALMKA
jgi:Holliday junction DNA helicase RuvA